MKYLSTCILFCCSFLLMAQTPSLKIKTDKQHIKIGEQLTFTIETETGGVVNFPTLSNLKGLEVAEALPQETLNNKLVKKYLITGFDSGAFYINKQQVFIDNKAYFTDSLLVNVATVAVDTAKIKDFINHKKIKEEAITFDEIRYKYELYFYLLLGVILIIVLLYYLFRNKKEKPIKLVPKVPAYITATKELSALETKQLWQNNKIKEYYSELTDIVRKYIGDELSVQALETTTDEFIAVLKTANKQQNLNFGTSFVTRLKGLLSQADFVKFAKQKPLDGEIRGHREDAEFIIETLHKIVTEKKKQTQDEVH